MTHSVAVHFNHPSCVSEGRRVAAELARRLNFNDARIEDVRIVATELGTNLVKHAREGRLIFRPLRDPSSNGLEILSIDKGPGMANINHCLADGYSTAGSPGNGLGAVRRIASVFDIYSEAPAGTVLLAQLWNKTAPPARMQVGAVCLPMAHEVQCGDTWALTASVPSISLTVADGLGHGELAARASNEAVRIFQEQAHRPPVDILRIMQGPLKSTRGASVAVAMIDTNASMLRYAGVGNITATILADHRTRSLVSHNGTVGHEVHRLQEFTYPWEHDALLVMHSDGIQTRWNLDKYAGLRLRHPAVIAGILYRDFERGRDDLTVVVLREMLNDR